MRSSILYFSTFYIIHSCAVIKTSSFCPAFVYLFWGMRDGVSAQCTSSSHATFGYYIVLNLFAYNSIKNSFSRRFFFPSANLCVLFMMKIIRPVNDPKECSPFSNACFLRHPSIIFFVNSDKFQLRARGKRNILTKVG